MLTVQCPHCSGALTLDPQFAGQPVRCPFCGQPFQMPIPPATPIGGPQIPTAIPVQPVQQVPMATPVQQPAQPFQTAYDYHQAAQNVGQQKLDTGDDTQRSFAGAAYAKSRVSGPSLSLMLFAAVAVLQCVVVLVALLILRQKGETPEAMRQWHLNVDVALTIIGFEIVYYLFVMYGAWKMSDLESHGLAITAAILAMLPASGCFVIGAPLGIWALAVLGDADVRIAMKTRGIRRY